MDGFGELEIVVCREQGDGGVDCVVVQDGVGDVV